MSLILIFVGGVLGASSDDSMFGFCSGALLGFLLAQVFSLRQRVRLLDEKIESLSYTDAAQLEPTTPRRPAHEHSEAWRPAPVPPAPRVEPSTAPVIQPTTPPAPSRPVTREIPQPSRPAPASQPFVYESAEPTAIDSAIEKAIAWIKGGNPLARIGIVILFFGATFLAKYAAEHSLFPIELRFIALAIGALALLVVGWRLRGKREGYAQLLQGGGVAGLYLTVFAATRLYQLLPMSFALVLLIAVAVASAILAVAQNSLALAVIGTAGGFLAPILVSTGSGNYVALFTYYAVLNLGVFTIAWFRTWRVLNVIGFVFTFTITALWRGNGYQRADLFATDAFLILFFLMYVAVSILNCLRQSPNLKGYVSGSLVFGLPVVAFALHASLMSHIEYAVAWSAVIVAACYLALAWTLFRCRHDTFHLLVEAFAALGVIFASLAIPLAFDATTTAAMWAIEGAGLLWLGISQERKLARAFAVLLQLGGGLGYFSHLGAHGQLPIANGAFVGAVMVAIAGVFSGYVLFRNRDGLADYEVGADRLLTLWGLGWWLYAGLNEINLFLPQAWFGCMLVFAAFTALLCALVGVTRQWPLLRALATYVTPLAAVIAFVFAIASLSHPTESWGAIGWLALFAMHWGWLYRERNEAVANVEWLHAGAVWLLTLLVAWECHWHVAQQTLGVWSSLPWGLVPAFVLAWLSQRNLQPTWPVAAHENTFRVVVCLPIAIAVAAWTVWANLSESGDPRWLPYLPLINPLDISVVLALLSIGLWWTSLSAEQRSECWSGDPRGLIAMAATIVFIWLNAALIRSLHHNFGAPLTAYGIAHSTLVQASLSIFWGVLGFTAMMVAARKHWRYLWMTGAGLMIVVVAKLFLVDLSSVGTVARIASFLSVGVLLLVTGYFAPLPPRANDATDTAE
jgi:uncharacterized membrane protein